MLIKAGASMFHKTGLLKTYDALQKFVAGNHDWYTIFFFLPGNVLMLWFKKYILFIVFLKSLKLLRNIRKAF